MIGKEEFIKFINRYKKNEDLITDLDNIFPNCFESELVDYTYYLSDLLLEQWFTTDGIDWVYYYLFENYDNCYIVDGEEHLLNDVEDLWNLVKSYRI